MFSNVQSGDIPPFLQDTQQNGPDKSLTSGKRKRSELESQLDFVQAKNEALRAKKRKLEEGINNAASTLSTFSQQQNLNLGQMESHNRKYKWVAYTLLTAAGVSVAYFFLVPAASAAIVGFNTLASMTAVSGSTATISSTSAGSTLVVSSAMLL